MSANRDVCSRRGCEETNNKTNNVTVNWSNC